MARTIGYLVKIMKQKLKVDDVFPYYFDVLVSFVFIKLFDSSSSEDLTPFPSLMELLKGII